MHFVARFVHPPSRKQCLKSNNGTLLLQASCVFVASNGVEALQCIASKMVDIILMDSEMPKMSGEENIRQLYNNNNKPYIIGFTASATDQARLRCFESGMNAFLSKPLGCLPIPLSHTNGCVLCCHYSALAPSSTLVSEAGK